MVEWQPIETAPYCERVLILFDNGHIEDATIHEGSDGRGWSYCLFDGETMIDKPTHWMPLPDPPETE